MWATLGVAAILIELVERHRDELVEEAGPFLGSGHFNGRLGVFPHLLRVRSIRRLPGRAVCGARVSKAAI